MKRLLIIAFSLLLIIGCKEENVLTALPDAPQGTGDSDLPYVSYISPSNGAQMPDDDPTQSGIQGSYYMSFSRFMDPATINTGNFIILNTATGGQFTDFTVDYYRELKQAVLTLNNVDSAGAFLIRCVSGGATNTFGSPLDGDQDNLIDGTPYDDYHATFSTNGNTDTLVNRDQPEISSISPESLAVNDQQPFITINFDMNMDTTTLNTSTVTLANEGGTAQTLTVTNKTLTQIQLQPTGMLAMSENFFVTVNCANIKRTGDSQTPDYLLTLDGDEDGPEATEPDIQWYFRVDSIVPPRITSLSPLGTYGARFQFTILIDEATITASNIRVFDNKGYVPGTIRIRYGGGMTYTMVDYYFKRTISGTKYGFVSKDVLGQNGYYFDGDYNGIGGEPWDDYYNSF